MSEPNSIVQVALPLPIDRLFSYRVPEDLRPFARIGMRVLVPFGRKKMTGIVVEDSGPLPSSGSVQPLTELLDTFPAFDEAMMEFAKWLSEYYLAPLGQTLSVMLPPGIDRESERIYVLRKHITEFEIQAIQPKKPLQARVLKALFVYGTLSLKALQKKTGSDQLGGALQELTRIGLIEQQERMVEQRVAIRYEKIVRLAPAYTEEPERLEPVLTRMRKRSPQQSRVLEHLLETSEVRQSDLMIELKLSASSLRSLVEKKLIEIVEREVVRDPHDRSFDKPELYELTEEQAAALDSVSSSLESGHYHTYLLHGITGSGKTEVYIQAIRKCLALGKGAIVLVPEIALTPQAVQRFKSHYGALVTVWHSGMSMGERFDSWRKIQSGDFQIVIGARSAVFAPIKNLGLIVVDEEHEHTYKQGDTIPRYHARDAAIVRATIQNAVVVLGSATPSLESFCNAQQSKYTLLQLPRRINNVPLPSVEIVDMRKEKEIHTEAWQPMFSRRLRELMKQTLKRGEQIILFQNRRGYANFIECMQCGHVPECPQCSISLNYHSFNRRLRCHYCGYADPAPPSCPVCANADFLKFGIGTQKIEEHLRHVVPHAVCVRMDLDTTGRRGAHEKILRQFEDREADILLGTQMVTKGLDFENVTLVGVISADTSLMLPDFRSSERTFQLLTQVAGRAGRKAKAGRVIIQTLHRDRAAIRFSQHHDYAGFYADEIGSREELLYPPFGRLFLAGFRGKDEKIVIDRSTLFSDIVADLVRTSKWDPRKIKVLGPAPAPIVKIRNLFRYHILIKVDKTFDRSGALVRGLLRKALSTWTDRSAERSVQIIIDADPLSLM